MVKEWSTWLPLMAMVMMFLHVNFIHGEDPYRFYAWNVTYGDIYPLGVKQQVPSFPVLLVFFKNVICMSPRGFDM